MARPIRLEYPGAVWHVTVRGNEKRNIFHDDTDRIRFLDLLADTIRRFKWIVTAYVLMSNHFHLVLELAAENLSRGMHRLNSRYSQGFNRRHDRVGHLFQGRFKAFLIDKENYMLEVLRYVVLNPVRAKMVTQPDDYLWSSYRATVGDAPVPEWLPRGRALDRSRSRSRAITATLGWPSERSAVCRRAFNDGGGGCRV